MEIVHLLAKVSGVCPCWSRRFFAGDPASLARDGILQLDNLAFGPQLRYFSHFNFVIWGRVLFLSYFSSHICSYKYTKWSNFQKLKYHETPHKCPWVKEFCGYRGLNIQLSIAFRQFSFPLLIAEVECCAY